MKKVLIITYYWPPAGGPGVQRWLKFSKYLPDFGIQPIVYKPKNPHYPTQDQSLNLEVSSKVKVIEKAIFEPYSFAKILSKSDTESLSKGLIKSPKKQSKLQESLLYVRGNYFIPDARKFWVLPSVKFLAKYISKHQIDCIISTGPPHSLHLIGQQLKIKFNDLKWIADFRDPWTNIGYHNELKLTEASAKKHQQLEQEVLDEADALLVTSFETQREFQSKTQTPVHLITNGFDDESVRVEDLDEQFSLAHIGSLLSQRNPQLLWEVLAELIDELENFKQFFELRLVGNVSEQVIDSINRFGLKDYVSLIGYVNHQKAIEIQQSAQVLLLIEINSEETKGIIPGKLFEYMNAKRPILAIGPENWDVKRLVDETSSGTVFTYNDKQKLKGQITTDFKAYLNGKLIVNSTNINQFSRKNLTEKLSKVIK